MHTNILSLKKRMIIELVLCVLGVAVLILRVAFIQIISPNKLKERAENQQMSSRGVTPKRGTIFDSTGSILAVSSSVELVTVNPVNIPKNLKEKVSKKLLYLKFN